MMRFYKPPSTHQFYYGIDLHARTLYLCALDQAVHALTPYRQGLVIAAECMFAWYWVADLCAREGEETAAASAETPHAAGRTVKLSTSYFFGGEILSPSGLRSLDFGGHKEVRPGPSVGSRIVCLPGRCEKV